MNITVQLKLWMYQALASHWSTAGCQVLPFCLAEKSYVDKLRLRVKGDNYRESSNPIGDDFKILEHYLHFIKENFKVLREIFQTGVCCRILRMLEASDILR
ncbi:hypothetical protein ACTXT7_011317 [Hymenolepis weldensis]